MGPTEEHWDWKADPVYESEAVIIDMRVPPITFIDYKDARRTEDFEIRKMLGVGADHIAKKLPYFVLVTTRVPRATIGGKHRRMFADFLEAHRQDFDRDDVVLVMVSPELIFRAVLRAVYRFRSPPMRTIVAKDNAAAASALRKELERANLPIPQRVEEFLTMLAARGRHGPSPA